MLNYDDGSATDTEWKVFHADTNGIYLIASDYVPVSKLTSQQTDLGFTTNGSYNIYWSSNSSFNVPSIDSTNSVPSRFMLNQVSKFNTGYENYKMTACLIDATKWNTFRDARWVDENDIIGGPTLEMYVASWNKKYPSNKLYTNTGGSGSGYYVGTSAKPMAYNVSMSGTLGYSDILYYPHMNSWNSCSGYWLASPSASGSRREMYVDFDGYVSNCDCDTNYCGVRPLVHLKSGVKLKELENKYILVTEEEVQIVATKPIWDASTHKASITLVKTSTDAQIQWQKGGIDADGWTTAEKGGQSVPISNLSLNDTIYVRLWDGTSTKKEATVKIEDGQKPEDATITMTMNTAVGEKMTAIVAHVDNQSGVNIAGCKWKFTTSQDELGTEATSYTGEMSGSFTSESENIECTANTAGTYWLHVLTVDKGNNAVETVSETSVTVSISASDIANDDELFQKVAGGIVKNYDDGSATKTEWKVFYADTNGIYLIASDYVPVSKLTSQKSTLGFLTNGTYNIYWNSSSPNFKGTTPIDSAVASRFMLNQLSKFSTGNNNYKMTACLIDATKWNTFRDARWVDENDIIGSPTLEMWIASWNKKYKNVDGELFCNNTNNSGYYVGTTNSPTSTYIDYNVMNKKQGYSDTLYYPRKETYSNCNGYWLTSPSAHDSSSEMIVNCNGYVNYETFNYTNFGVRPLVHLKSGVKLKEVSGGYEIQETITDLEEGSVYYADKDGNGTPDGVIFADLTKGSNGEKQWYNSNGKYTIPKSVTNPKQYVVTNENYSGPFGTGKVLTALGTIEERFYIMSLSDISSSTYTWYGSASGHGMSDYSSYTSGDFGTGKENTTKMITKWKANGYGAGSSDDVWSVVQGEVAKGWFVPSRGEWAAFANELGITKSNYTSKDLSKWYWSSSQGGSYFAWGCFMAPGNLLGVNVYANYCVRMSASF